MAEQISTSDGLSLALSAGADVTSVVVDGTELVASSAPAISIRDMSAAGSVFSPNLLYNGSFEIDDGSGGADGWSVYLLAKADLRITTDDASQGARSLFVETDPATQNDGEAAYLSSPVPVSAGVRYRFSARMRARHGYLALRHTAPEWQQAIYGNVFDIGIKAGGILVAWYDNAQGSGTPIEAALVSPMHTNAEAWKRIAGEARAPNGAVAARVVVVAKLLDSKGEDDGVWIDEVSMIESPEADAAVTGTVTPVGGSLELAATVAAAGLDVEATYTPLSDRIEIQGRVIDTTASARSLELALRLPVDLDGYTWWDDIRDSRAVSPGSYYRNWLSADAGGKLPQSLYPLAALDDGTHGLALSVPLDSPRVVLLSYDRGVLEARFRLGVSPAASRLSSEATFRVSLYRYDASWGFRSALEKFVSFHPAWFKSSRPVYDLDDYVQGNFTRAGACLANCDQSCDQCCSAAALVACYDQENIGTVQYTAPEGPMKVGNATLPPPTYTTILSQLATPPSGQEARYQALAQSMIIDGNGDFFLKHLTNPKWAPTSWEANWVLNMDPDIAGGYAEWERVAKIDASLAATQAIGARLEGIQFDNFMSAPAVDLDPSHFPLADESLTYDPNTYQPGIHTMSSTFEYLTWLRDYLDSNYTGYPAPGVSPGLSANIWGMGTLNFLAPFLDGLGNETQGEGAVNWGSAFLNYRRSITYHKPLSSPWQRPDVTVAEASQYANIVLFYGARSGRASHGTNWEQGAEEMLDAANQTLSMFWQLGWEPVTYATIANTKVWAERFGSSLSALGDSIYFTVHNWDGVPRSYDMIVDTAALGIADTATLLVKDARSATTLSYTTGTGTMTVSDYLEADGTDVVRLMAPGCSPTDLASATLTLKSDSSKDRLRMKGGLGTSAPEPDFTTSGVTFVLADQDGDVYEALIPAGSFLLSGGGKTFKFKDRSGTIANGLVRAKFTRRNDSSYKWQAKARNIDLSEADRSYLDVFIRLDTMCWADSRSCLSRSKGKKLRCRP